MINTNCDFIHNTGLSKDNSLVHLVAGQNRGTDSLMKIWRKKLI